MTSEPQKRAQARYDKKRQPAVLVRLSEHELDVLDNLRVDGESRPAALKRLALIDSRLYEEGKIMIHVPYGSPAMEAYIQEGWIISSVWGNWCTLIMPE